MKLRFEAHGHLVMVDTPYGWDDTNLYCASEGQARALVDLLNGHPDESGIVHSQKVLLKKHSPKLSRDATVVHL